MASLSATESPCDPNAEARRILDIEITQLESRLLSLRRSRNALAPISRVHSEILQEIFAFTSQTSTHQGKTVLLLTWICHDWRDLAIQTSSIWTHIDFTNPEWIELSLSRTRNRKLEFSMGSISDAHKARIQAMITLCFGNLSRMKTIRLLFGMNRDIMTPKFPPHMEEWRSPAPVLQELKLSGVFLPSNLFSGTCPALQTLHLSICSVHWPTLPSMPNLRALHLEGFRTRIPLHTMVQILSQIGERLEILVLMHTFAQPLPPQANPEAIVGRVNLPNLVYLDINEIFNGPIVKQFLDAVSLPDYLNANFSAQPWDGGSVAKSFLDARRASGWSGATLKGEGRHGVMRLSVMETWSYADSDEEGNDQSSSASTEELNQSTTTFYPGGRDDAEEAQVFGYFGGLGTVEQLVLDPQLFAGFLTWITAEVDHLQATYTLNGDFVEDQCDQAALQSDISFHDLFELALDGKLGLDRDGDIQEGDRLLLEDVQVLRRWLVWRNRAGLMINSLSITGVRIPASSVLHDDLQGYVVELMIFDAEEEQMDSS